MHYKEVKGILSATNGMNVYRGCSHGCIYCDSRSKCYDFKHDFEDIEIKSNCVELLERKLRSKWNKCMIGTGSMSDPYIPLEREIQNTRKCLEVIEKYGFGVTLITKSTDVLRDLDILKRINEKSKCVVQMTLTTYDEKLCKIIEPNLSSTKERFEALKVLRDSGIPTVVWICPFLPYINDTEENLRGILDYCVEAEVKGIIFFGFGVTLREGNREYFYEKLDEHFVGLKELYQKRYGNRYSLNSPNDPGLRKVLREVCDKHGIEYRHEKVFEYLNEFPSNINSEQLSLFWYNIYSLEINNEENCCFGYGYFL